MGYNVGRIHSKEDDKVYNILPMGQIPTVVFGRVIRPNSVPGMMYWFGDGVLKKLSENTEYGYEVCGFNGGENIFGYPIIFTVPEDFDFSKMDDNNYVVKYVRSAEKLNANTTSPNYEIRGGELICVKKMKVVRGNYSGDVNKISLHGENLNFYVFMSKNIKISHNKRVTIKKIIKKYKCSDGDVDLMWLEDIGNNWKNSFTIRLCGHRKKNKFSIYEYTFKKQATLYYDYESDKRSWRFEWL